MKAFRKSVNRQHARLAVVPALGVLLHHPCGWQKCSGPDTQRLWVDRCWLLVVSTWLGSTCLALIWGPRLPDRSWWSAIGAMPRSDPDEKPVAPTIYPTELGLRSMAEALWALQGQSSQGSQRPRLSGRPPCSGRPGGCTLLCGGAESPILIVNILTGNV